ncbi:MAG: hypothetical protein COA77_02480 [Thaumarchaeota archaeon]|nr:MAG: hypothetical protein COA77_02480 [Nitrososphaerota archaeon]
MKKPQSFSCEESKWTALEPIAKKEGLSRNQVIQKYIDRVVATGEIEPKSQTQGSIDSQLKAEQLTKAQNSNSVFDLKKRELTANVEIKEYHANSLGTIGATPSPAAHRAMEHYVNQTQPYDEKAIHCPDCKWQTSSRDTTNYQINSLVGHMKIEHLRALTEKESEQLTELLI